MKISNNYVAIEKIEEQPKEGFQTVEIQDSSTYKGRVVYLPEMPVCMGNTFVNIGDIVLFAKYSPDTHEITNDGRTIKFVSTRDLLAVL